MMLPTHAVVGLALAAPLAVSRPELGLFALLGGLLGSLIPDLDLYAGHRRTLHYPTGYTIAAAIAVAVAFALTMPTTVGLAFLLVGAAVHCRMDRYGGGLELRPWEGVSERAVYDHVRGEWRTPKRWIEYDGSPRDVVLALLVGVPLFVVLPAPFRWVVLGALVTGCAYGLLRRRLAAIAPAVFDAGPEVAAAYVPDRYRR
jgi:hypothetical protein